MILAIAGRDHERHGAAASDRLRMFYWKNAIVLIVMLALAYLPVLALSRSNQERGAIAKLAYCGVVIACVAVSFVPMTICHIVFGLLLLLCFEKRVPMVASYLFFLVWTPAAAAHLVVAGAYFAPFTPIISFSLALGIGYLTNPDRQLQRKANSADVYLIAFLIIYCICISLRGSATDVARNIVTYVLPSVLSYHVVSRSRIEQPELVMRAFVFAAAAAGLLCLFEMVRVWPIYSGLASLKRTWVLVDTSDTMLFRGGLVRAFGPFSHPLTASAVFGMAGVMLFGLVRLRGISPALLAIGAAILLGLFATVSRTGVVALTVGLMTVQMLRGRYTSVVVVTAIGLFVMFGLPFLSNADTESTGAYRMTLLMGVPKAMGSRLIFGYREAVSTGLLDAFLQGQGIVDLVNIYLSIAVNGGIVSLVPYLLFLGATFTQYRALLRTGPDTSQLMLAQSCVGIQAGFAMAGIFMGAWGSAMQISFLCVAIVVALRGERNLTRGRDRANGAVSITTEPGTVDPFRLPALR